MPGLRGVGKTTILAQTYRYLVSSGVPRARVLYATMDSVGLSMGMSLNDLISSFEKTLLMKFENLRQGEEVFLLLDEIQYDPDWALALKVLFDRSRRVFVLSTGSSMISLTSTADTARRAKYLTLDPLTFREYLRLANNISTPVPVSSTLTDALFGSCTAETAYKSLSIFQGDMVEVLSHITGRESVPYLRTGTMPSTIGLEPQEAFATLNATLDKVIDQDLAAVRRFDRSTLIKAHQLVTALAVADRISHDSLCRNLAINNRTLIELIESLVAAGVIQRLRPYGSESTRMRKTPKYKFTAPAIRVALLSKIGRWGDRPDELGRTFEDVAALYLRRWIGQGLMAGFDYVPGDGEADLVVRRNDGGRTVIELSWGNKGLEQVFRTMDEVRADKGVLISDGPLSISSDGKVLRLPKEWFLLGA